MKVYISGPITGRSEEQYRAAFGHAAEIIRDTGHEAINPVDCSGWGLSWDGYMQIARTVLSSGEVDAVLMLKGWEESRGAARERFFASSAGIPVIYQDAGDEKKYREM